MSFVRVTHHLDDLVNDLTQIATTTKPRLAVIVSKQVDAGRLAAQGFAREASGRHGTAYYKRITSEMHGPLEGEFGPTGEVRGRAVGAGWRHGENTDLPRAADVVGPAFAKEVSNLASDLFWPGT